MTFTGGNSWSAERVALLRKLWTAGLSCTQIARQMGGVTRNAVIGKVHRLGLAGRATPSRPKIKRPPRPPRAFIPPRERPQPAPRLTYSLEPLKLHGGEAVSFATLSKGMCKFPFGDVREGSLKFCGRTQARGPYCGEHAALAYVPNIERERAAHDFNRRIRNL